MNRNLDLPAEAPAQAGRGAVIAAGKVWRRLGVPVPVERDGPR